MLQFSGKGKADVGEKKCLFKILKKNIICLTTMKTH